MSVEASTPEAPIVGRGRWQIPTYLLDNDNIMEEVNTLGKETMNDIIGVRFRRSAAVNPQSIFAGFKTRVYALFRANAKKVHPSILGKIEKLKSGLSSVNNDPLVSEEDKMLESLVIKTEILELERILFESNRVYAKAKHHVHAETICRDWVRSNRARKPRDTIFSLHNPLEEDHADEHDSQAMAETARQYHENLQSMDRDPTEEPDQTKLGAILDNISARTLPDQKRELAKHLEWGRVHAALTGSGSDKAAGLDGIPMELWKKMSALFDAGNKAIVNPYCDIVGVLTKTFRDIEEHGIDQSTKFNEGWMCPIYKKGDRNNATNYRPITVLNTDYKLMTRALANKLAEAAPTLIHRDQAGFIKGRSIFDQVRLAKLAIDYGRLLGKNGAIVALDQEKAYDKILLPYLWKVLEKFDIPRHFIKTVRHIYQGASTSVIINRMVSAPYQVARAAVVATFCANSMTVGTEIDTKMVGTRI